MNKLTAIDNTAPPGEPEIRAQLSRILASDDFVRSPRLRGLLEYLIEESLAGRIGKIKATTIAIDVYGRDSSFDQQSDPIVRVEAGRLRQRLTEYYAGEGQNDALVIEIPKGGYRPAFTLGRILPPGNLPVSTPPPQPAVTSRRERSLPLLLAVGIIGALLAIIGVLTLKSNSGNVLRVAASTALPGESKPYIVITPVASTSSDEESVRLGKGLVESMITHLSKLSGLSVMAHASVLESQQRDHPFSITDFRGEFGVTHLLRGTVERKGESIVLFVQLVDAKTAKVIWAERLSRSMDRIAALEEELALAITTELAVQLQPGERERLSQYHASNTEAWLLYRQGLFTIMPPTDTARVQAARQLFMRAIEADPSFAGGLVGQSFFHSTRVLFMSSSDPDHDLAQALEFANRAITLDPDFGGGYAMLAFAQILAGETKGALHNARTSVAIQPGDAFSQFVIGMSHVIANQPARGAAHLKEALRLDPLEARVPYLNVMAIAYYVMEDYSGALAVMEKNYARGGPRGPHMDIFIAAANAQLGQHEQARELIAQMQQKYPGYVGQRWLERWLTDPDQLRQTLTMLGELGLEH
jgi:TolB-like protein